jgi:hypothetical protein
MTKDEKGTNICVCGYTEDNKKEGFAGILSMDFDGVMNTYVGYDGEDNLYEPREGLEAFLEKCKDLGFHTFYIHSARNPEKIKEWLVEHGFDGWFKKVSKEKLPADVYLDDRAVCFNGDFEDAYLEILCFKVHWDV